MGCAAALSAAHLRDFFNLDVELIDQNMPEMDLSLIKTVQAMKNYQNVPIVMLTAESGADVKALGKAADANK